MYSLQEQLCEQDNSDNSVFFVNIAQTEEYIASDTSTITINIDWIFTWEVVDCLFNQWNNLSTDGGIRDKKN